MVWKWRRAGERGRDGEDLLVISDVHLGEDILHEGPEALAEYIRAHNRELSGFVAYHRVNPGERPWHLVLNGDLFDFLKVTDLPDDAPTELSPKARAHALRNTEANVLWKLSRVLAVHRPFFKELARFLLAGHRLTFLEGNHDAEVYFPAVREALRRALLELVARVHREENGRRPIDAEALAAAVQFRTWFLAKPGAYHIEHGHLYDPFSSVAYHLAPLDPHERDMLATPLSHKALPYVADMLGDFSTHGLSERSLLGFFNLFRERGMSTLWAMAKLYVGFGVGLAGMTGKRRRRALAAWENEHAAQLSVLAAERVYDHETLSALDALRAVPAEYSLMRMARRFYFDKVALGAGALAGIGASFVAGRRAGLAALACGLGLWLTSQSEPEDLDGRLAAAAAGIAARTQAKVVVFGHSHNPRLVALEGAAATYVNSGCWVTRELVRGAHGSGMTFVEITPAAVTLRRWMGPDQPPLVLGRTALG